MDSFPPLCHPCARSLLTHDDDPMLVESKNHQGQPVLAKLQTETSIKQWSADFENWTQIWPLEWPKFLAGIKQPLEMVPNSCDFCEYLLQLLASDAVVQAVRGQEEKIGHTYDEVSVGIRRSWAKRKFPLPARFAGLNVSFTFRHIPSTGYSSYLFEQNFFLTPHASSEYSEVATWLQCHEVATIPYTDAMFVDWMRDQLATCEKETCSDETDDVEGFTPQRLLDVTAGQIKLVLRASFSVSSPASPGSKHPRYAALSYCWGDPSVASAQIKTTKDNEVSHQAGIPLEELTQTLREAVTVCRSLDIPYLWVDALCILQDDDDDWNQQCVDMCNIYSNAYVTLCASSSRSCSDAFTERKGQLIEVPFISKRHESIRGKYVLRAVYTRSESHQGSSADWDREASHWAIRGWVLQERVLSTRSITFGDISLHFQCQHDEVEFGVDTPDTPRTHFLPLWFRQQSATTEPPHVSSLIHQWRWLVTSQAYNGKFTRPADLLPSLSGLASLVKDVCPAAGDYVAGLWTTDLHLHLCQFEGSHRDLFSLPARADYFTAMGLKDPSVPSWSPLNGLSSRPTDDLYFIELKGLPVFSQHRAEATIEAEVNLINSLNPFGAIKSALLKVRSLVLDLQHPNLDKLQLCYRPYPVTAEHPHPVHTHAHIRNGDHRICKVAFEFSYPKAISFDEDSNPHYGPVDASMDLPSMRLLLLGTCKVARSSDGGFRKGRGAYGLILWPSPTNPQRWRRIGVFFPTAARGSYREGYRLIKRLGVMEDTIVE